MPEFKGRRPGLAWSWYDFPMTPRGRVPAPRRRPRVIDPVASLDRTPGRTRGRGPQGVFRDDAAADRHTADARDPPGPARAFRADGADRRGGDRLRRRVR